MWFKCQLDPIRSQTNHRLFAGYLPFHWHLDAPKSLWIQGVVTVTVPDSSKHFKPDKITRALHTSTIILVVLVLVNKHPHGSSQNCNNEVLKCGVQIQQTQASFWRQSLVWYLLSKRTSSELLSSWFTWTTSGHGLSVRARRHRHH